MMLVVGEGRSGNGKVRSPHEGVVPYTVHVHGTYAHPADTLNFQLFVSLSTVVTVTVSHSRLLTSLHQQRLQISIKAGAQHRGKFCRK